MKYSRGTEVFIQWRDPDSRQVYGLSFQSSEAADGFQQWLDFATNPPAAAAAAAATRNAPPAPKAPMTPAGESHYQRPAQIRPSNGPPDVIDCHQQSVYTQPQTPLASICCGFVAERTVRQQAVRKVTRYRSKAYNQSTTCGDAVQVVARLVVRQIDVVEFGHNWYFLHHCMRLSKPVSK